MHTSLVKLAFWRKKITPEKVTEGTFWSPSIPKSSPEKAVQVTVNVKSQSEFTLQSRVRDNLTFWFFWSSKKSLTKQCHQSVFTACKSDQWGLYRNIISISDYTCSGFPRCLISSNQFSISPVVWQTASQEATTLLPTGFKLSICLINLKTPISALWPTVYVLHTQN